MVVSTGWLPCRGGCSSQLPQTQPCSNPHPQSSQKCPSVISLPRRAGRWWGRGRRASIPSRSRMTSVASGSRMLSVFMVSSWLVVCLNLSTGASRSQLKCQRMFLEFVSDLLNLLSYGHQKRPKHRNFREITDKTAIFTCRLHSPSTNKYLHFNTI